MPIYLLRGVCVYVRLLPSGELNVQVSKAHTYTDVHTHTNTHTYVCKYTLAYGYSSLRT